MELIKEIQFADISDQEKESFQVRKSVRAIVFDGDRKIGLLHVEKEGYHKLPGGGLEGDEGAIDALKRECKEEIGCGIEVYAELGEIVEYKEKQSIKQLSYCYLANIIGKKGEPEFTEAEHERGFKVEWHSLEDAINLMKNEKPEFYEGLFIHQRDLSFLENASRQEA